MRDEIKSMSDKVSIRDLTTQLENNDGHNASNFFKGKFEEERFKDLDAIRKLNEQDRAAGRTGVTLNCQKDIYYNDTIRITAEKNGWDEFNGGKELYSDSLDLHTLKHSDPTDQVPALRAAVDIRKLTAEVEGGDGNALKAALDGKYQEERASILEQVGALNARDLIDHKTKIEIDIDVADSKHNANKMRVTRVLPGFHDSFFGGHQLYEETLTLETGKRDVVATKDNRN
jgi:hypothetical protein